MSEPNPRFIEAMEGETAKLRYLISIDEWVFSYGGAHWKAPESAVKLANHGPFEVTVPIVWLMAHGD